MELYRKAYQDLLKWKKESCGSTAVMIEGARRVGKSTLVQTFGKKEYKSCLIIDFTLFPKEIKDVFENELHDFDSFFQKLSIYYNVPLFIRESVIIFDEVQIYPKARQLIKHLVADGRYDYIETGSLISLKQNVESIVLPSEEEYIQMHPLDFEEFLLAMGEVNLYSYIKECYEKKNPVGDAIHRKIMNLFRQYMIVGGMPQSVLEYIKTKDFGRTDVIKRRILKIYRDDVSKFAKGYESKVLSIFDELPAQLSKHEKKFRMASLHKNARFRDYEDAFMWLSEAKIADVAFNSTDPNVGLGLYADRMTLKCYMEDTGLLFSHAFYDDEGIDNEIYKAILFDKLGINEGMFMENIVAQMLTCSGHNLYFYSRADRINRDQNMEIDFLIKKGKKICPIEVKSSNYRTHSSLDKFKAKFSKRIGDSYIIYTKDLKVEDGIICLPVYMTALL